MPRRRRLDNRTIGAALLAVAGLSLVAGGIVLVLGEVPMVPDPVLDYNVYLASHSLALAGSCLAALVAWSSLRRLEVRPRRETQAGGGASLPGQTGEPRDSARRVD